MPFNIPGSVVLVTAGTSGLGLGVATKLVQHGANVVINYASNKDRANSALSHLQEISSKQDPSPKCIAIQADVMRKSEIERLVSETVAAMGKLDAVVSNAGWTKFANFSNLDDNVDEDVWDKCYAANVKCHLFLCHAAKKYLENAKGAFVMTSSVAGVKPSGSSIVSSLIRWCLWLMYGTGLLGHKSCTNSSGKVFGYGDGAINSCQCRISRVYGNGRNTTSRLVKALWN
jgi:NAD(P)-dependent dehydrogenase (short-subunit alcohol dehydrogenase family)